METIIGLGNAGCAIADEFAKYKQYSIYKIDDNLQGLKKNGIYNMPWQDGPERYEAKCPKMKNFFKNVSGEVLFIVSGAGNIAGATLNILENIKHCGINVLYIEPDLELLPITKRPQEKSTYYILQEYARSGVFKRIFMISNPMVEDCVGDVVISEYNKKLNSMICSTFHMINVYNHIDPISDTFHEQSDTSKIATIGYVDIKGFDPKLFFPLDRTYETRYYYAISKKRLEEDGTLLKTIKEQMKSRPDTEGKISYGIFQTNYEQDYVYTMSFSRSIQYRNSDNVKPG